MRRLIVTADDLGYSPETDDSIFTCIESGVVRSVSLLVTGMSAEPALRRALAIAEVSLGLHLNLTEGPPITSGASLADPLTGGMWGKHGFRERWYEERIDAEEVEREVRAQIDRFLSWSDGVLPTHVDGHQHVHVLLGVPDLLGKIMREYGIRATRIPFEAYIKPWVQPQGRREFYETVSREAAIARVAFAARGVRAPAHFLGFSLMGANVHSVERVWGVLGQIPRVPDDATSDRDAVWCEYMVHPGRATHRGGWPEPDEFAVSSERELERRVYTDPRLRQIMTQEENIRLSSYKDFNAGRGDTNADASTVLLLCSATPYTGNHVTAHRLAAGLREHGAYRTCVYDANSFDSDDDTAGRELTAVLERVRPVAVVGIHAHRAGRLLRGVRSAPFVTVLGGTDMNEMVKQPPKRRVMQECLRRSELVVAFHEGLAQKAREMMGRPLLPILVVPQAVRLVSFSPLDTKAEYDALFGDKLSMLLPLGVRPVKDPGFLIDVVRSRLSDVAVLTIVGPILDPDAAKAIKCGGNVKFIDALPRGRLLSLMSQCAVLVNSSIAEGMSNTLLEGMALGSAVICARKNQGNCALIRHECEGLLFETPDEFATCVSRVLRDENGEWTQELKTRARLQAKRLFEYDREARAYVSMVRRAAAR